MKYIDHKKLNDIVSKLFSELREADCVDDEEYRLSQDLKALPIGLSLWSYTFITHDGKVISTELEPGEFAVESSEWGLIRILAWGVERYPLLNELISERPQSSEICPLCNGSKVYGTWMNTDEVAVCVHCNGLGWVLSELWNS